MWGGRGGVLSTAAVCKLNCVCACGGGGVGRGYLLLVCLRGEEIHGKEAQYLFFFNGKELVFQGLFFCSTDYSGKLCVYVPQHRQIQKIHKGCWILG